MRKIAWILLIVGGINWGLVGLGMLMGGDWNVLHMIFGSLSVLEGIIYLLVGVSAVWLLMPKKATATSMMNA